VRCGEVTAHCTALHCTECVLVLWCCGAVVWCLLCHGCDACDVMPRPKDGTQGQFQTQVRSALEKVSETFNGLQKMVMVRHRASDTYDPCTHHVVACAVRSLSCVCVTGCFCRCRCHTHTHTRTHTHTHTHTQDTKKESKRRSDELQEDLHREVEVSERRCDDDDAMMR
jgi:hypothetical protein